MTQVFWLASYPKSGNTWMRAFLSNFWDDGETPVNINDLRHTLVVSDRQMFDDFLSCDSGSLTQDELDLLRPAVYRAMAQQILDEAPSFWKIHDAFQRLPDGQPLFPRDVTGGVVYIVRSPLDLAVSYAHHNSTDIDQAITWMNDPEHGLFTLPTRLYQIHQRMFTWSQHVSSWLAQTDLPQIVIRYEDMFLEPLPTFQAVVEFVTGTPQTANVARIEKALRFSSFAELKKQEQQHGFAEKAVRAESFFRKGVIGDWRNRLSSEQVQRIVDAHHAVMQQLGYLTESGEIVDF